MLKRIGAVSIFQQYRNVNFPLSNFPSEYKVGGKVLTNKASYHIQPPKIYVRGRAAKRTL